MTTQRQFHSTKAHNKRPASLSLKKPMAAEKQHVVEGLSGNVPVVLSNRLDTDHDYFQCPGDIVNSEHSYI